MKDELHLFSRDGRHIGDTMPYYYDGVYHLFYLLNASGNVNIDLEHAWTTDLIHWHHAPTALCREEGPEWMLDTGTIFTGSFLTCQSGVHHLWYTSWNPDNPNGREFIRHAVSHDLFHWRKQPNEIIAPLPHRYASGRFRDFRDPCVVPDGYGGYDMFCLANPPSSDKPNDFSRKDWIFGRLHSQDLIHWEQREPIEAPFGDECPDYHIMDGRHVLLSARHAFLGDTRYGPYHPADSGMDGPFVFAGKTLWDGARHIWLGSWIGPALLTPREVYMREDRVCMRPVRQVLSAFDRLEAEGVALHSLALPLPKAVCMLEADLLPAGDEPLRIQVGDSEPVTIAARKRSLRWKDARRTLHALRDRIHLQLILSPCFIELFVDDQTAFSFPLPRQSADTLLLSAPDGSIQWRLTTMT